MFQIKWKFILLIIGFVLHIDLFAQNVKVINAHTGGVIEGVIVSSNNFIAQTDENGFVDLSSLSDHQLIIFQNASFKDYSTTKKKIRKNGFIVSLLENPVFIDEIVVSANRWQQSIVNVPQTVQMIDTEEVLLANKQTSADLVGGNSNVFIQKSQMGGGSPMIRGFSANRILLVVDGIRMNNAIYRSGNLHNIISVDINSLNNVEIILGPGSVIYGSDALGGVISFNSLANRLTTLDQPEHEGRIMTRFGTANKEKTIHGMYSFNDKKWGGIFSFTYSDFDDLKMGSHGRDEYLRREYISTKNGTEDFIEHNDNDRLQLFTGYHQVNLMSKLRYRPSQYLDIDLSVHHSTTSDIPRYDRLLVYKNDQLKYAKWYYGPQEWTMGSLQFKINYPTTLFDNAVILTGYQQYKESRHDRLFNSKLLKNREEKVDVYSINFDFNKRIEQNHQINYGAEIYYNDVFSEANNINIENHEKDAIATRYPDGSNYQNWASYLSYQYDFSQKLSFQVGTRYTVTNINGKFDNQFYNFPFEDFDSTNDALIGNVGLIFHPDNTWKVNIISSTGFRSPNIDDFAKVFDSEPGNIIVPNLELKPEYALNFELGVMKAFQNKAKIGLNFFYTKLTDAMVRRDYRLNGKDSILYDGVMSKVSALVNVASAKIYGGSANFSYLFNKFIRTENQITIINGEDSEKKPLRHVPPLYGKSHFIYENRELLVDLNIIYNGEISFENLADSERKKPHLYALDNKGNPFSPSWYTLNLSTTYYLSKNLQLNLSLENILNKRYRSYSSGIVAPGFNVLGSISYNF